MVSDRAFVFHMHVTCDKTFIISHATKLCGYNVFDPSVSPSVRVSSYVVARIVTTFVDGYTRNFGKLSVIVKALMGWIFRKFCHGDHFWGGGLNLCHNNVVAWIARSIYTKLWEVVSNSKSMDVIDFQKNLSRGSLFGD